MPRVVVIDDEEMVATLTGAVLGMKGYDVKVATSGQAGIQLVFETLPDAVVCDVRMPEVGGEQVIQALRSHAATSHIPVVLISGQCDARESMLGDAFFQKPFNVVELVATLDRFCSFTRTAKHASIPPSH
jgi:twitching motility two-component system response regulator PilH